MRALIVAALVAIISLPVLAEPSPEIVQQHEEMLFTEALVRTGRGSGSGTVIYSQIDEAGAWATYVLTNHHVVASAIRRETFWKGGEEVEVERLSPVDVLFYVYNDLSRPVATRGMRATIEAYSEPADLALLRLSDTESGAEYVARMHDPAEPLYAFTRVWAVGAGLGEPPFATTGLLSRVSREIDGSDYLVSSAPIVYGSSGGALFRYRVGADGGHYFLVGVTSMARISGWQLVEHIGFSIPMARVRAFLVENCFGFVAGLDDGEECSEE